MGRSYLSFKVEEEGLGAHVSTSRPLRAIERGRAQVVWADRLTPSRLSYRG